MDLAASDWHSWGVDADDPLILWLREALPAGCGVAGGAIGTPGPSPYPEEEAAIVRAAAQRRYEFRSGRIQARRALAEVGAPAVAIPRGAAGEPRWPMGYVGSIAHADGFALAVAAGATGAEGLRAMGLDVESGAPLEEALRGFVCRAGELQAVPALGADEVDAAKRLFVAKEAFTKLNYALTGTLADPLDIQIGFQIAGPDTHAFSAILFPGSGSAATAGYEGRLGWGGGRIAAVMYVRHAGGA